MFFDRVTIGNESKEDVQLDFYGIGRSSGSAFHLDDYDVVWITGKSKVDYTPVQVRVWIDLATFEGEGRVEEISHPEYKKPVLRRYHYFDTEL